MGPVFGHLPLNAGNSVPRNSLLIKNLIKIIVLGLDQLSPKEIE